MNYGIIRYILGWIVMLQGAFMAPPAITAAVYGEFRDALIFAMIGVVCGTVGFFLRLKKPRNKAFFAREGFVAVVLTWVVMALIGTLPFIISGTIPSFIDALFETVSGFSTTGATILTDVEVLPHGMLLWRSFTHWIGGMGVLVFMLAVLPMAGGHSMYLMKAESPGPTVSKLVPNLRKTAMFLYSVYLVMTVVQFVLLITIGKMPIFDAICIAFGTAGTGGFGVLNDSMASYTIAAQVITTIFMLLFGINFAFYFLVLTKKFKAAFSMEELRWYMIFYFGISALIIGNLLWTNYQSDVGMTIYEVLFQTASVITTTGYSTVNFDLWPQVSRGLMVVLMCTGACAGSTCGGFKLSRVALYAKSTSREISHLLHPRSVKVIKMDGKVVERETLGSLHAYLFCYVVILLVSTLLISLDGRDLTTNFTAAITTLNNIGPGLGDVGPAGNFADFSVLTKAVSIFNMLAGRLEIFPILLMFAPSTWKK